MTQWMLEITPADIAAEADYELYYQRGYRDGLWDANYRQAHAPLKRPGYEHGYFDAYVGVVKQKLAKELQRSPRPWLRNSNEGYA